MDYKTLLGTLAFINSFCAGQLVSKGGAGAVKRGIVVLFLLVRKAQLKGIQT
jgi:hypothetical protein